jgi:hypothetical protein
MTRSVSSLLVSRGALVDRSIVRLRDRRDPAADLKHKLGRVIGIWVERGVADEQTAQKLKGVLGGYVAAVVALVTKGV